MIGHITVAALAAVLIPGGFAQSPRPAFDAFEVASIRLAGTDQEGTFIRMQGPHRFYAKNYTLKSLVGAAYNLTPRGISGGPAWIVSEHFDIVAKTPGDVQPDIGEQMSMLRKLLAERFQLKFHREQKEFSIFALTVAKNGSKLEASTAPAGRLAYLINVVYPDHILLPARNASMAEFASTLQRGVLDRPVVDRTGLSGRYDFDLEWTPDETQFGGRLSMTENPATGNAADSPKQDIFAALREQLGLRLEAIKGPIDTLVIDKVERPSDN
jgi:uncharacterized protein (TIGR03435 family)